MRKSIYARLLEVSRRVAQATRATVMMTACVAVTLAACTSTPITERNQLVLISEPEATEIGRQAFTQILEESDISASRQFKARVERIGRSLVREANAGDLSWEFAVIDDDAPNAFALPGGKVAVHTGMLALAKSDDQLAAVMGHEIAHVTARHWSERLSRQALVQMGANVVGAAAGQAELVDLAAAAATLGVTLPFSRQQEAEADEIGLHYMARAGYDPRAAIALWQAMSQADGNSTVEFLSTHPSPNSRIQNLQKIIADVMPTYRNNRSN